MCEIGKDFGQGFYVTKIKEQAHFWAERRGGEYDTSGYVTEFEFNENAFSYFKLKTLRFPAYNEDWLDFNQDESKAIDTFFLSETFSKLADPKTGYYEKSWTEIYEILKNELK